ncbi:hypothetical protein E6W39_28620 [Kitasatospora acidiphila]|uniref:Uncharacterized protein n=1 Tax=Kitasatospora acidiphila TaxID=2567942 RepID=A0A540W8Z3_9ACTN|nr:hypothetical protein E6W39_28620 [Kitasatospora acidiphila]
MLELPFLLPDTAVTARRLAITYRTQERPPYFRGAGRSDPLPGGYPRSAAHQVSAIPEFGMALITDEVVRLTVEADCG